MEHSSRRIDSLVSLCIDDIVSNLSYYALHEDSLKYLPSHLKSRMLKKFLVSSFFWENIVFNDVLSMLVHPLVQRIDLSSASVNDETLEILKDCRQLKEVYLTRVKNYDLTSQGLIKFLTPLSNLFMLQLSHCYGVSDEVLVCLAQNCPALAGLDVGGCVQVTDVSVIAMSQMQKLQWLTFSATQVSNKGIATLVGGPSGVKIKELRLSNCNNVGGNILQEIIQFCPNIEILVFYNVGQIDNSRPNEAKCQSLPDGSLKNLKQLTWTVHW